MRGEDFAVKEMPTGVCFPTKRLPLLMGVDVCFAKSGGRGPLRHSQQKTQRSPKGKAPAKKALSVACGDSSPRGGAKGGAAAAHLYILYKCKNSGAYRYAPLSVLHPPKGGFLLRRSDAVLRTVKCGLRQTALGCLRQPNGRNLSLSSSGNSSRNFANTSGARFSPSGEWASLPR